MKLPHRILASFLLMAYAITGTSIMPAVMLMMANLDGSHRVQVQESENGTQLVLRHDAGHYTPNLEDHSENLARVLVSMSASDQFGDHSLVSAHVKGSITSARDLSELSVKSAPALNYTATASLILWVPSSKRHDPLPVTFSTEKFTPVGQPMLATVQLLI